MKFKTGECSEEEREGFYPVTLYCEKCGKDATTITYFDEVLKQFGMNVNVEIKMNYLYSIQII